MSTRTPKLTDRGRQASKDREARLAEALRDNLRKRKAQARSRAAQAADRAGGSRGRSGGGEA